MPEALKSFGHTERGYMDNTLSQILTYLYSTLQENARLQQENAALRSQVPAEESTPEGTTP